MAAPRMIAAVTTITALVLAMFAPACARPRSPGLGADLAAFCRIDHAPPELPPEKDEFFAGLEVLARALPTIAVQRVASASDVRSARLEALESEFRPIVPTVGLSKVGALFVHGWSVHVEAAPARCTRVLIDLEAERAALSADEAEIVGESAARNRIVEPPGDRVVTFRTARLGLLDMGEGPFKFDYRWTFDVRIGGRSDGVQLVRYDFQRDANPEHVSVFSGVAIAAPEGTGTRLTEILAVGSTLHPPFFLKGKVRDAVADMLSKRAQRLVARMTAR